MLLFKLENSIICRIQTIPYPDFTNDDLLNMFEYFQKIINNISSFPKLIFISTLSSPTNILTSFCYLIMIN